MPDTPPKLTIVEDDTSIAYMYQVKFQNSGFDVTMAKNGEEGLRVIEANRPDIILLDLKMPIMDGAEMLDRLRNTDWGKDIKVIVLTNISRDEAPHTIRHLGIAHYIVKSHTTPAQILDLVKQTLDN